MLLARGGQGEHVIRAEWVVELGLGPIWFMVACWALWAILSMPLDAGPVTLISVPVFYPIALKLGIDPIQFGVLMQAAIIAGQATPPFALNIFAIAGVAKIPIEEVDKAVWPFCAVEYGAILLIIFFPSLSTWLPNAILD